MTVIPFPPLSPSFAPVISHTFPIKIACLGLPTPRKLNVWFPVLQEAQNDQAYLVGGSVCPTPIVQTTSKPSSVEVVGIRYIYGKDQRAGARNNYCPPP